MLYRDVLCAANDAGVACVISDVAMIELIYPRSNSISVILGTDEPSGAVPMYRFLVLTPVLYAVAEAAESVTKLSTACVLTRPEVENLSNAVIKLGPPLVTR